MACAFLLSGEQTLWEGPVRYRALAQLGSASAGPDRFVPTLQYCVFPSAHPCRYYGGIKLGAGGLVRAYGGAARECLKAAPKRTVLPKVTLALQVRKPLFPMARGADLWLTSNFLRMLSAQARFCCTAPGTNSRAGACRADRRAMPLAAPSRPPPRRCRLSCWAACTRWWSSSGRRRCGRSTERRWRWSCGWSAARRSGCVRRCRTQPAGAWCPACGRRRPAAPQLFIALSSYGTRPVHK